MLLTVTLRGAILLIPHLFARRYVLPVSNPQLLSPNSLSISHIDYLSGFREMITLTGFVRLLPPLASSFTSHVWRPVIYRWSKK